MDSRRSVTSVSAGIFQQKQDSCEMQKMADNNNMCVL
jgi:hypothetical protein